MRTMHTGRTPAPKSGGAHHWEKGGQDVLICPTTPPTHTHIHWPPTFPSGPSPALSPQGLGGTNQEQTRPRRAAGLPGPPPEVRQHNRVPGTRTGRAAIWPGSFPVGFPLHSAPGQGQGHSPSSQSQKAWILRGGGTITQVPRSQGSCSQWFASQVHGRWCPGRAKLLADEGVGGGWALGRGSKAGPRLHRWMHVCLRMHCRQGVEA